MTRPDPHSVADDAQPRVAHLDWRARLDFAARVLVGEARLALASPAGDVIDLDTRELVIERVTDDNGAPLRWELTAPHPFLGQRLRVELAGAAALRIRYRTSPAAPALQWADDFVYSQCQPIDARALVPLPDSPSRRLTYRAELTTPRREGWRALMAATATGEQHEGDVTRTTWEMARPIPPHLIALVCGALSTAELAPLMRVHATGLPAAEAARDLAIVPALLDAAEAMLGPYRWQRCDLVILPRTFPHGGMENPMLAFLSPSLITGDGSLAQVVAHELVHAWTGNVVGNASLEHFWINEAPTVYVERRVLERVLGSDVAELHAASGRRDLARALAAFAARPELTRLRTTLEGVDPDEALSIVPYEKGYLLMRAIEAAVGRDALDRFLRELVEHFAWQSITTETLRAFAEPRLRPFDGWDEWLNAPGLPPQATAAPPPPLPRATTPATPLEWRWVLDGLPRPYPDCAQLEHLLGAANPDVRSAFVTLAIESDHPLPPERYDDLLASGRLKEIRPIYVALARRPATRALAAELYRRHQHGYHAAARRQIERVLRDFGTAAHVANPLGLGRRPRPT